MKKQRVLESTPEERAERMKWFEENKDALEAEIMNTDCEQLMEKDLDKEKE